MRLGDLDALKEDFKSRLADCNKWIENAKDKETKIRASAVKAFIAEVIMTIDNAPSVEPFERIGAICNENCGYKPQGEWIDYDNTFYKCPDCGYLLEKCCPQCQNKVILPKGGAE